MSTNEHLELIRRIHDAAPRAVVAVTGGGSRAIADLLSVPGASRTVLEAAVPYASEALVAFLGTRPEQFCDSITARRMAMTAYRRAVRLRESATNTGKSGTSSDTAAPVWPVVGLGLTASLASEPPKRGPHRIHLAAQTESETRSWSLTLTKGKRTRAEEEIVASTLLLDLLAEVCGISGRPALTLRDDESVIRRTTAAPAPWIELLTGRCDRTDVRVGYQSTGAAARAILPGSFCPLHEGHRRMASFAAARLGVPVDFEISIENVEKPPLDYEEMEARAAQFPGDVRVWFTRAPRMLQKARLFPGATIVCGIDTLLRVADVRFAGGDAAERDRVVREIADAGCRFLVFGRSTAGGFSSIDDADLPDALRHISTGVPESEFRIDVSSTELRRATFDESCD